MVVGYFLIYSRRKDRCLTSPDEELRVSMRIWAMEKGSVIIVELSGIGLFRATMIGSGVVNW